MNFRAPISTTVLALIFGLLCAASMPVASADPLAGLSEEKRTELMELVQSASQDVAGVRMFEALQSLNKAEAIAADFHVIHNLRGAVYTKLKDFEKARASFDKSIRLQPDAYEARFNFHEIYFVTGEYQKALDGFQKLLDDFPRMPESIRDMARYKVLLCHIALDQTDKAKVIAERFSYLDDTPVYYFANAAMKLADDDEAGAAEWIGSAGRIYGPETAQLYVDGLQEMGLMPSISAVGGVNPNAPDGAPAPGVLP